MMLQYILDSDKVFHVSKAGNDANSGKAAQYPVSLANDSKLTIGSAVAAASNGDIIIIWPGTYVENVDIATPSKSIIFIGVNRYKTIIKPTTGNSFTMFENSELHNLSAIIEDDAAGMGVHGEGQDNCVYDNCTIKGRADGLYVSAKGIRITNCYIFATYDALYCGNRPLISNCTIHTDGTSSGGVARCITFAAQQNAVIENCVLIASPPYEKATGRSAELYESDADLYCISGGGNIVLNNCILFGDSYKPGAAHADSYHDGDITCIDGVGRLNLYNCILHSVTDQNKNKTAYGISSCGKINLMNVTFNTVGQLASYDFYAPISMEAKILNTFYDSAKVANTTLHAVPDDTGGVEAAGKAMQAVKLLVNKAIQTKATGVIDYYDDDGSTVILTHTPTDEVADITRTPS